MLKCNLRHRMADNNINGVLELMRKSKLSRAPINKLYKNIEIETIKVETLISLCDALNCKLSDLIEYTPDK